MTSWLQRHGFLLGLGLLILAGLGLRYLPLPVSGLSIDDIFTLVILKPPVSFDSLVLDRAIRVEANPPLYYLLAAGWQALFGDDPAVLKALGTSIGALALLAAWLLGRKVFPPRVLAMQIALLAVSYGAIATGLEARPYSLLLLFGTIQTCLYFKAERRLRTKGKLANRRLLAIALVGALAAYAHYFGLIFTGAVFALLLLQAWRRFDMALQVIGFGLLTLLFFLPWLIHELPRQQEVMAELSLFWFPDTPEEVFRQFVHFTAYLGGGALTTLILFLAFLAMLAINLRRLREPEALPFARVVLHCGALVAITCVIALVLNIFAPMSFARYFLVLLPALYLGVAAAFELWLQYAESKGWQLLGPLPVLLLTAMLLYPAPILLRDSPDHWGDAVDFAYQELHCRQGAMPIYQPTGFPDGLVAFDYYLDPLGEELYADTIERPDRSLAPLETADPDCRLVAWVHDSYFRDSDIAARLQRDFGMALDPETHEAAPPYRTKAFGPNILFYRP